MFILKFTKLIKHNLCNFCDSLTLHYAVRKSKQIFHSTNGHRFRIVQLLINSIFFVSYYRFWMAFLCLSDRKPSCDEYYSPELFIYEVFLNGHKLIIVAILLLGAHVITCFHFSFFELFKLFRYELGLLDIIFRKFYENKTVFETFKIILFQTNSQFIYDSLKRLHFRVNPWLNYRDKVSIYKTIEFMELTYFVTSSFLVIYESCILMLNYKYFQNYCKEKI